MSEPVSNAEMEDVLASIRRLVSQEKRPAPSHDESAEVTSNGTSDAAHAAWDQDKLVLTPSLRVAPNDPEEPQFQSPEETDASEPTADQTDETVLDAQFDGAREDISEPLILGTVGVSHDDDSSALAKEAPFVHVTDESAESEFPDGAATPETVARIFDDMASHLAADEQKFEFRELGTQAFVEEAENATDIEPIGEEVSVHLAEDAPEPQDFGSNMTDGDDDNDDSLISDVETQPAEEFDEFASHSVEHASLGAKIAALEAVIARQEAEFSTEETEEDALGHSTMSADMAWPSSEGTSPVDDTVAPQASEDVDAAAVSEEPEQAVSDEIGHDTVPDTDAGEEPSALAEDEPSQDVAPLELMADQRILVESLEHDAPEPTVELPPEQARQDDPAELQPTTENELTVAPETLLVSDTPEDLLDEEAVRDLVAEIVQSELQGALGERITRNVRKLVRREIHRALAARDLE